MRHRRERMGFPLLLLGLALGGGPAAADEIAPDVSPDVVGRVTALSGHVVAEREGEVPRTLQCRDPIYRGDRIVTSENAAVGVLTDDVYARLGPRSKLHVDRTAAATSDLTLEEGAVRVVDPRSVGSEARLAALDAAARVLGNDAEAYLFSEKTGRYAMLCEWDAPLPVERRDERVVADPGKCVIAKAKEPLYLADAHDERLAAPAEDACALGPLVGAPDLTPASVAAGGLGPWSGPGMLQTNTGRSPCDVPGSGCEGLVVIGPTAGGGSIP